MLPSAAGKLSWKSRTLTRVQASGPSAKKLFKAARRRELDRIVVWRLDRWGRSLLDLVSTLQELASVNVGFVSLSEALDLTTPSGRALAGMLAIFAEFKRDILRDRVKAGIAQARKEGRPHGRPPSVAKYVPQVRSLARKGLSKSEISRRLRISRTSVRRFLGQREPRPAKRVPSV
jgi:putative DNA-invertase from lambdoid prophage Rac